jgi:hypothetical protein
MVFFLCPMRAKGRGGRDKLNSAHFKDRGEAQGEEQR